MTTQKDFEPQVVGINQRLQNEALKAWEKYIEASIDALCEVVSFLNEKDMETEQFISIAFLGPKQAIVRLYELSGQSFKGMNTDKLIENGIISNEYHSEVERYLNAFQQAKKEAESLFKFDLAKLRDEQGLFSLSDEFHNALKEHCTVYTQSAQQNEALEKLKQLIDSLNFFSDAGLIKPAYGTNSLSPLMQGIRGNIEQKEFEPALNLFKLSRWNFLFK